MEAWFAVDENTPVILEIPRVDGRRCTAQRCGEWADIIDNLNDRNYPDHPCGKFALALRGSSPPMPEDAIRIDLPSRKAKMLARGERMGDDAGAVELQRAFEIVKVGEPAIGPPVDIPRFTNNAPIRVDALRKPMAEEVLPNDTRGGWTSTGVAKRPCRPVRFRKKETRVRHFGPDEDSA
jgi:hypothetical protein